MSIQFSSNTAYFKSRQKSTTTRSGETFLWFLWDVQRQRYVKPRNLGWAYSTYLIKRTLPMQHEWDLLSSVIKWWYSVAFLRIPDCGTPKYACKRFDHGFHIGHQGSDRRDCHHHFTML